VVWFFMGGPPSLCALWLSHKPKHCALRVFFALLRPLHTQRGMSLLLHDQPSVRKRRSIAPVHRRCRARYVWLPSRWRPHSRPSSLFTRPSLPGSSAADGDYGSSRAGWRQGCAEQHRGSEASWRCDSHGWCSGPGRGGWLAPLGPSRGTSLLVYTCISIHTEDALHTVAEHPSSILSAHPTSRSQAVAAAAGAAYAATRSDEVGEVARTAGRQAIDAVSAAKSALFPVVCVLYPRCVLF
jgi:hypothetical protein